MVNPVLDPVGVRKVVTTDELIVMLARGERVYLPGVAALEGAILAHYDAADRARLNVPAEDNEIVSVEYVRDDEVQCIRVADERHLYITDDFIPTHNTANIVFLKSTDDSMIDTLQKMSGTRHKVYRDTKTVTKDMEKILKLGSVEGKVSYTMTAKEEAVITYNDMAFISERNSILFRAGDAPVWNRNETILPMSWRLFKDTIVHPGHEYSLQTIPTLSTVAEYDPRRNQPDFFKMLDSRIAQAVHADDVKEKYRKAFGFSETDVERLDPDVYSDEIMDLINDLVEDTQVDLADLPDMDDSAMWAPSPFAQYEENEEFAQANAVAEAKLAQRRVKRYAEGLLSQEDLSQALDSHVIEAYRACFGDMQASRMFRVGADGSLLSASGSTVYISKEDTSVDLAQANDHVGQATSRVFEEDGAARQVSSATVASWRVLPEMYAFLGSLASWQDIANGEFDRLMAAFYRQSESQSLADD